MPSTLAGRGLKHQATGSPESKRAVWRDLGDAASTVQLVERYGYDVAKALEVRDVHLSNLGWDLEFHFPDGHWEPIEVKGSAGTGAFIITRNEWRAAREHHAYTLFHVINIGRAERTAMRIFRQLGHRLSEAQMTCLSWIVKEWAVLEPEEVPLVSAAATFQL